VTRDLLTRVKYTAERAMVAGETENVLGKMCNHDKIYQH